LKIASLSKGNYTATLEYIGEGWSGDYNPEDLFDQELLRFYVYEDDNDLEDCSYCTQIPADTEKTILLKILSIILNAAMTEENRKKRMEELSWISPYNIDFFKFIYHDK